MKVHKHNSSFAFVCVENCLVSTKKWQINGYISTINLHKLHISLYYNRSLHSILNSLLYFDISHACQTNYFDISHTCPTNYFDISHTCQTNYFDISHACAIRLIIILIYQIHVQLIFLIYHMHVQLKLMFRSILLFTTPVFLPKTKFNFKWVRSIFIRINNEHINIIRITISIRINNGHILSIQ